MGGAKIFNSVHVGGAKCQNLRSGRSKQVEGGVNIMRGSGGRRKEQKSIEKVGLGRKK